MKCMSKNIENEKRLMLDEEQYELLMKDFMDDKYSRVFHQINYYFDDENLSLRNNHIVLRIRSINLSKYELTVKIKGKEGKGDLEINIPLSEKEVNDFLNNPHFDNKEIVEAIKSVTNKPIKLITSLETHRLECPKEDHLVVIDKNHYSGITDYNLEIEAGSMEDATKYILHYAKKYHLTYQENYLSKSRRAINRALNIKN